MHHHFHLGVKNIANSLQLQVKISNGALAVIGRPGQCLIIIASLYFMTVMMQHDVIMDLVMQRSITSCYIKCICISLDCIEWY